MKIVVSGFFLIRTLLTRFRYKLIDEEAAAREASKSPKGKKASAKPKNEKSEDVIDATPEPVAEPEKEEKLQQLYMSTPDGTHLRFGIHDGKIFVRLLRDHDKVISLTE